MERNETAKNRKMADTVGFEPTIESPLYTLSRRAPSTTRPRVRLLAISSVCPRRRIFLSQGGMICNNRQMIKFITTLALMSVATLSQATTPVPTKPKEVFPSPNEIVAAAPANEWVAIAASDLLVMDLAPDPKGKGRRVVIQLMPAPFSQGWVGNIRKLAAARWWDGLAIVRVQDNYVTQWGDPDGEDAVKAKKLPEGLAVIKESKYAADEAELIQATKRAGDKDAVAYGNQPPLWDPYGSARFAIGWPFSIPTEPFESTRGNAGIAPVHCYGMVGVGRNMSPDTGTGAELYTVIGHAPRHLDRNIALVGRVIEGIEHLSSLPRGTGPLGFYEKPEERTTITSIRMGQSISDLPAYEYLSTESATFSKYADARANRRDPFFNVPAGGADICNIPVPVRRVKK
jgi:peptidylprolyl isomerase